MINNKLNKWIERAYNYCNLNSYDDDCIYKAIYKYKALRELNDNDIETIYNILRDRLGF